MSGVAFWMQPCSWAGSSGYSKTSGPSDLCVFASDAVLPKICVIDAYHYVLNRRSYPSGAARRLLVGG
jgi:hypothetical protein